MKNSNKRLLVSIAALVISIALAATSTFAWFTMDATPEVSNIDLTVTSQDGLDIAYYYWDSTLNSGTGGDAISPYKSYFDFDGVSFDGADYDGVELNAVTPASSAVPVVIGYEQVPNPAYDPEEVPADEDPEFIDGDPIMGYLAGNTTTFLRVDSGNNKAVKAGAGSYLAVRLRFRSYTQYAIHMSTASVTSTATHGDFNDWDGAGSAHVINTNAANAARIGFVESTYDGSGAGVYTPGTTFGVVYNPNHASGYDNTTDGFPGAKNYYEYVTGNVSPIQTSPITPIILSDLAGDNATNADAENLVLTTLVAAGAGDVNFGYYVGEVTVYIWMEGTDADCFNIIMHDALTANFSFLGV